MRFFRWLVALVFAWILVLGMVKWYQTDYSSRDKDLFSPVWTKLATLVQPREKKPDVKKSKDTEKFVLHPDVTQGTLPLSSYNSLVQGSRVLGNTKWSLVMVIFCDYSVGYCKELHDSWAIYDYQKMLENNLAIIWKPFPKSPTSATLSSHRAYICAEKTANDDQLLDFQQFLFAQETYSDNDLIKQADKMWIPWFEQCFTKQRSKLTALIQEQRQQAKTMVWLTALPTIMVYNTNTQDYYKIPGWYELEEIAPTFEYINEHE